MRRSLVLALVLTLLGGALVTPAHAQKKKKKPVTFEESGSFVLGHPATLIGTGIAGAGVTGTEFIGTCGIPASQGLDGYVVELSDEISQVPAEVSVSGSDATGTYDLDMYFFNAECGSVGEQSTENSDEVGAFAAGTKYVLVTAFMGLEVEFTLEATEIR